MRIVVFSDLHIHPFPEFGAAQRLEDCISVLGEIRAFCVAEQISIVAFGGDLFHVKGTIKTSAYVRVANELRKFKKAGIQFLAVDGNHDHDDKAGTIHALQPLNAGRLLQGVPSPGYRVVALDDETTLTLFSFCESYAELKKRIRLSAPLRRRKNIALFHHGFAGARVGSTLEYVPPEAIDAARLRLDEHFGLVLSGHYHTHQPIQGAQNAFYVGSPLEHTRSDKTPDGKGFLVVDTKKLSFERVILKRPRFVAVSIGSSLDDVPGNFVDVLYDEVDERLDAFLSTVRAAGAQGVNLVKNAHEKAPTQKRLNVNPALSPVKVVRRYAKHASKQIAKQRLDRRQLIKLGVELLKESDE